MKQGQTSSFLCLCFLLCLPSFLHANLFSVQVSVEATDVSPQCARDKALLQGRRQAFTLMISRLVAEESRHLFEDLNDQKIASFILGTTFQEEKYAKTYYFGQVSFQFDAKELRRSLQDRGLSYIASVRPPLLLVPFLTASSGPQMWQEDNAWLNAWPLGEDVQEGLISVRLPLGDLQDHDLFPVSGLVEQALSSEQISQALSYYTVEGILVSHLQIDQSSARLTLYHVRAHSEWQDIGHFDFDAFASFESLLESAKKETLSLVNQWVQSTLATLTVQKKLGLLVPINSLAQWLNVQNMLQNLPSVEKFQVHSLSTTSAFVKIKLKGKKDFFERTLKEEGWALLPASDTKKIVFKLSPLHLAHDS